MEKRRVRLEINGIVCGLITEESDEYMQSLADEVGDLMRQITEASPYITREAAALTVALSYCDDLKKSGRKAIELQERVDELEVEAELWQEEKAEMEKAPPAVQENPELLERLQTLERENTALTEAAGQVEELRRRTRELEDENAALQSSAVSAPAADNSAELASLRQQLTQAEDLRQKLEQSRRLLESENAALKETLAARPRESDPAAPAASDGFEPRKNRKNPLRYEDDLRQEGIVSFFEKKP